MDAIYFVCLVWVLIGYVLGLVSFYRADFPQYLGFWDSLEVYVLGVLLGPFAPTKLFASPSELATRSVGATLSYVLFAGIFYVLHTY